MSTPSDQIPPKQDRTWVWVLVIVLALCLCCVLFALLAGFLYVRKNGFKPPTFPSLSTPVVPFPNMNIPGLTTVTPAPPSGSYGPLTFYPYDPSMAGLASLQSLVSNWQPPTAPGVQIWHLGVGAHQPVVVFFGWCASDQATLDANYQHLTWLLSFDSTDIPLTALSVQTGTDRQGTCKSYAGLVKTWPTGSHDLRTIMRIDLKINDGTSDYAAGDYVDDYQMMVSP